MKEVLGCGIDIEELVRFGTKIPMQESIPGFAQMVYTHSEIECNLAIKPEVTFPLCFSCKEAFFKAFGVSWTNSKISWKDIELLFYNEKNLEDYSLRLSGFAEELYHEKRCTGIESWIEYTTEYIIFQVILLS